MYGRSPDSCDLSLSHRAFALQPIIPTDAAHETIAELGELGLLQFKDLNPEREAFARTYASQVRFMLPATRGCQCCRHMMSASAAQVLLAGIACSLWGGAKQGRWLQVKRCNEMSRRLRFFHEQVTGAEIFMAPTMVDTGFDLDELEVRAQHMCISLHQPASAAGLS